MTQDAFSVVQLLFSSVWSLFTSWNIPGTNVTPGGFAVFLAFAFIMIRFVHNLLHESYHSEGK